MKDYLIKVFHSFVPLNGSGIPVSKYIDKIVDDLMEREDVIIIGEENKGVIIGVVYPCFWNPEYSIAQELGWWVEPEYRNTRLGIQLLKTFERVAEAEYGADKVSMGSLEAMNPAGLDKLYLKMGYNRTDHSYIKDVA